MKTLVAIALALLACSGLRAAEPWAGAVIHKENIEYPLYARQHKITGAGIYVMNVDRATGNVTSVEVKRSAGNAILDEAGVRSLKKWKFRPGTVKRVQTPLMWTVPPRR